MKQMSSLEEIFKRIQFEGALLKTLSIETPRGKIPLACYRYQKNLYLFPSRGIAYRRARRYPAIVMKQSDLCIGNTGWFFAICEGNFSTLLTPLFSGLFGKDLCNIPSNKRSEMLLHRVIYINRAKKGLELYQRDTDFNLLIEADNWLQSIGLDLHQCRFYERTPEILKYTEAHGLLWRVRPKVYSAEEKRETIAHAWQQAESAARYYVSVRGIHWLSYEEFSTIVALSRKDKNVALMCLQEWVGVPRGKALSAMCRPKANHHAIEFLGVKREDAEVYLIAPLTILFAGVRANQLTHKDLIDALIALQRFFKCLLIKPSYASMSSLEMIDELYDLLVDDTTMNPRQTIVDFNDRRMAVPGATFLNGKIIPHPGVDPHTLMIIKHLTQRLSINEKPESINIFVVRSTKTLTSESSRSREIVIKTNRTPVPISYIQKKLSSVRVGYSDYLLARANVFRALGADLPAFEVLTIDDKGQSEETPYFLRTRCPGDPITAIPDSYFKINVNNLNGAEDPDVVLALANLYGSAAADNLIAKKYIPKSQISRFGIGKEIFEFTFDPFKHRLMPARVQTCSIRGTMGWPDITQSEANLQDAHRYYLNHYASVLGDYWHQHAEACTLNECANAFFDGFMRKVEAMHWSYTQNKTNFDNFDPHLRATYNFREKLNFALWSLNRAAEDLSQMRERFLDAVRSVFLRA